jgi:hypothetical protein
MKVRTLVFGAFLLALPALGEKIHTIRVAPLVSDQPMAQPYANLITAKLVSHLAANGVSVIEDESDTKIDAILKVNYMVTEVGTQYRIEGPVRLIDGDGKVIWADDVRNSHFARSASSSFAENVALKVEAFLSTQK